MSSEAQTNVLIKIINSNKFSNDEFIGIFFPEPECFKTFISHLSTEHKYDVISKILQTYPLNEHCIELLVIIIKDTVYGSHYYTNYQMLWTKLISPLYESHQRIDALKSIILECWKYVDRYVSDEMKSEICSNVEFSSLFDGIIEIHGSSFFSRSQLVSHSGQQSFYSKNGICSVHVDNFSPVLNNIHIYEDPVETIRLALSVFLERKSDSLEIRIFKSASSRLNYYTAGIYLFKYTGSPNFDLKLIKLTWPRKFERPIVKLLARFSPQVREAILNFLYLGEVPEKYSQMIGTDESVTYPTEI